MARRPKVHRFVAVDGEALTIGNDHRYVLLADSTGRYEWDQQGLSTVRCLEFLLTLPAKSTPMGFGFNYDVNMILRDVPTRQLIQLWKEGRTRWQTYSLEWIPNKWFRISAGKRKVKIQDAFGFFQSSFVKSLERWGFEPPPEIESMKQQRSGFNARMKRQIIDYCVSECRLLVELMDELELALKSVDINLSSWVGAGSIASGLMRREKVKEYHDGGLAWRKDAQLALLHAYFGGRTELYLQGSFERLFDYDISSAYPAVAQSLPALNVGEWRYAKRYESKAKHAVWHCRWKLPTRTIVCPFPFRRGTDIYYPSAGEGWYHAAEVAAARRLHPSIKVLEGWVWETDTSTRPFSFIPELYRYRQELKAEDHGGEKVLKLGLNALYGKLAQGYGYNGQPPPFQSYFWAGEITATTRARILDTVALDPANLVMVATDGIFFREEQPIDLTPGLGGMELTVMENVFVAQPGVYHATVDGIPFGRSRGFFAKEIDFDDLRSGFADEGPFYVGHYHANRFSGLGSALLTGDLSNWRTWNDYERKLSLYPSRKYVADEGARPVRHNPPAMPPGQVSDAYTPKQGNVKLSGEELDALVQYVQGAEQPTIEPSE